MGNGIEPNASALLWFIVSFANFCFLALGLLYQSRQRELVSEQSAEQLAQRKLENDPAPLWMALSSQIIFIVFTFAWLLKWISFSSRNAIQILVVLTGLGFSFAGFYGALRRSGFARWAGVLSSGIAAMLWLLIVLSSIVV